MVSDSSSGSVCLPAFHKVNRLSYCVCVWGGGRLRWVYTWELWVTSRAIALVSIKSCHPPSAAHLSSLFILPSAVHLCMNYVTSFPILKHSSQSMWLLSGPLIFYSSSSNLELVCLCMSVVSLPSSLTQSFNL